MIRLLLWLMFQAKGICTQIRAPGHEIAGVKQIDGPKAHNWNFVIKVEARNGMLIMIWILPGLSCYLYPDSTRDLLCHRPRSVHSPLQAARLSLVSKALCPGPPSVSTE